MTKQLLEALRPLTERVRIDITAVRMPDGSSRWSGGVLDDAAMLQHLSGGPGRGVCPIKAGESVTSVAVLDFDSHKGATPWAEMCLTVAMVADALALVHGVTPTVFRSSGGHGIHLYVMWETPQDAYSVRRMLADTLRGVGLRSGTKGVSHGDVEINPKQSHVPEGKFGNQFILPLTGKSELLEYDEFSGGYVSCGRVTPAWLFSSPVDVVEPPAKPAVGASTTPYTDGEVPMWRLALDALSNQGEHELGYDDWWRVISAIHHETGASPEGFAIALAWSARSTKHDADFFETRVWSYLASDGRKGNAGGSIESLATRLHNWHRPIIPLGAIPDPDEGTDPEADRRLVPRRHALDRAAEVARDALQPIERRGVPPSKHLTTDLANANRLVLAYGASILVVGERWHVWTGKTWRIEEGDVYRFACKLSAIIRQEAVEIRKRAADGSAFGEGGNEKAGKIAEALEKWSAKSEMKGAIEAALGLARKMLAVEPELLNASPWLLNCRNGVVDLRTGQLLDHDPAFFMTRIVDVDYDPAARAPLWDQTVLQITREVPDSSPVADFLQRWFGYCATGDVSEQAFVVHWGDGANGKSTLIGTVTRVLGTYAGVAAPGLVATSSRNTERHPTGLADLMGQRMVVAHESGEGAVLTDDVIKAITGGDRMKARYMQKDFFEFSPTHKVQLLTNHKPQVKGTDHGIWRRVCLVSYGARFGSADEVAKHRATAVKNPRLLALLGASEVLQAVLAWLVRGAVAWYQDGGLRAPDAVLDASNAYRFSQDRVSQFVDECCEAGEELGEPVMVGTMGLYPAYVNWCKEAGGFPLARGRFVSELQRLLPAVTFSDVHQRAGNGMRRKVRMAHGIQLLS